MCSMIWMLQTVVRPGARHSSGSIRIAGEPNLRKPEGRCIAAPSLVRIGGVNSWDRNAAPLVAVAGGPVQHLVFDRERFRERPQKFRRQRKGMHLDRNGKQCFAFQKSSYPQFGIALQS